jgi:hypothetical protein
LAGRPTVYWWTREDEDFQKPLRGEIVFRNPRLSINYDSQNVVLRTMSQTSSTGSWTVFLRKSMAF